jgi:hypothetical protein
MTNVDSSPQVEWEQTLKVLEYGARLTCGDWEKLGARSTVPAPTTFPKDLAVAPAMNLTPPPG